MLSCSFHGIEDDCICDFRFGTLIVLIVETIVVQGPIEIALEFTRPCSPLPALGHVAAPVGSLCPVLCSTPPTHAIDDHVRCTVIALSGNVVAELFVLKGQPWLDAIPFGCWCHCWNVASFHLSDKDMVVFPRPRLSQLVPSHGPDIVLKLITSNDPPPVNIRVVIGKAAATSAAYRPQPSTSPPTTSASFRLSCYEIWIRFN